MIEEGIQNVVDSLQGISLSDIESENANEAKEDERQTGPVSRKHSRSPSVDLGITPVPKKPRTGTRTAAQKVSESSILARGAEKESKGTRRPQPVAQGEGNP